MKLTTIYRRALDLPHSFDLTEPCEERSDVLALTIDGVCAFGARILDMRDAAKRAILNSQKRI